MHVPKIAVAVIVFATIISASPASAVCSNATFKGAYGYYHGRPGGGAITKTLVGQITADGEGNVSATWTLSTNGTISTGTTTGTYSISSNCTGTLTLNNEDFVPANFSLVFDNDARGFQLIQTDTGTAQAGFGFAQGTPTCGLTGKKHTFATNLVGTLFPSSEIEAIVGQLTLDGKGSISGNETFSVDGVISKLPITGSYTVNSDCTGTVQITPMGSAPTNFNAVVVNGGAELLLIETDSNTLIAGTAQE
jgi:hypothetical protein